MKDPSVVDALVARGRNAEEKARKLFDGVTPEQFNKQPAPDSWSAAKCLEHLVISDSLYFTQLDAIGQATYRMSRWARLSPFSRIFGYSMRKSLDERNTRRMKTHPKLVPAPPPLETSYVNTYLDNLNRFLRYVEACRNADLDEIILASPVAGFVTYSLRDALSFLIEHEHRHLNQAARALSV